MSAYPFLLWYQYITEYLHQMLINNNALNNNSLLVKERESCLQIISIDI